MGVAVEIDVLARDECEELLRSQNLGWASCEHPGGPVLAPVAYVLHEGEIVFRVGYHDRLAATVHEPWVSIGVSLMDPRRHTGWYVTVSGRAHLVGDSLVNPGLPSPESWPEPGGRLLVAVPLEEVRGERLFAQRELVPVRRHPNGSRLADTAA